MSIGLFFTGMFQLIDMLQCTNFIYFQCTIDIFMQICCVTLSFLQMDNEHFEFILMHNSCTYFDFHIYANISILYTLVSFFQVDNEYLEINVYMSVSFFYSLGKRSSGFCRGFYCST